MAQFQKQHDAMEVEEQLKQNKGKPFGSERRSSSRVPPRSRDRCDEARIYIQIANAVYLYRHLSCRGGLGCRTRGALAVEVIVVLLLYLNIIFKRSEKHLLLDQVAALHVDAHLLVVFFISIQVKPSLLLGIVLFMIALRVLNFVQIELYSMLFA